MSVDPEIIRQAQNGDEAAFGAVFRAYKQRVFGTVYRMIGRRDVVEDVGQDVLSVCTSRSGNCARSRSSRRGCTA